MPVELTDSAEVINAPETTHSPVSTPVPADRAASIPESTEKRREARYPCNDPAQVRRLSGDTGLVPGIVLDISRSGMRVETRVQLQRAAGVEVILPGNAIVLGEVRYSRRVAQSYHAGILIEDVYYARRNRPSDHLQDYQLSLYLARKDGQVSELLGVREHLLRCKLCTARYQAVVKLHKRLQFGNERSASGLPNSQLSTRSVGVGGRVEVTHVVTQRATHGVALHSNDPVLDGELG